jgi:hypothetical protein
MSNEQRPIRAVLLDDRVGGTPLDFVTGLLGVNLGGTPGRDDSLGFLRLTVDLAVFAVFLLAIFQRLQWPRPNQSLKR